MNNKENESVITHLKTAQTFYYKWLALSHGSSLIDPINEDVCKAELKAVTKLIKELENQ